MKRVVALSLVVAMSACEPPPPADGIAVGNPGKGSMTLALAEAEDFTFETAEVPVGYLGLSGCSSDDWEREDGRVADLVATESFELQAGTWCGLAVQWDGLLQAAGAWATESASGDFELHLDLQDLAVDAVVELADGDALLLELAAPDWLDADALGLQDGDSVVIDAASPEHPTLAASLESTSTLFRDDGDGVLSATERAAGPVAATVPSNYVPRAYADASQGVASGCSCSAGGGSASWLLLLLPLLRRRR